MEIYFDKRTLKVLKEIAKSKDTGTRWDKLYTLYSEDASPWLLVNLSIAGYTVTQDGQGKWLHIDESWPRNVHEDFRSFCTPKALELLERRCFDFWKWVIPTMISTAALIVSTLSAIFG